MTAAPTCQLTEPLTISKRIFFFFTNSQQGLGKGRRLRSSWNIDDRYRQSSGIKKKNSNGCKTQPRGSAPGLLSGESQQVHSRERATDTVYSGFWQPAAAAAAAQRNNSWCFCGLTLLTSCLTGNTLHTLCPTLPVACACNPTGAHTHTHKSCAG